MKQPWLKPGVFVGSLMPLAVIALQATRGTLGTNAIERVLHQLGLLALIFLVASLAPTPLKAFLGWTWPIRLRRMVGLFAFFYATLHFLTYLVLDQGTSDLSAIWTDVTRRPFIAVGFAALLLLTPLAVTSTDAMVRQMGFARWKRLHRLAYAAAALAIVHFVMRVKADLSLPILYGLILALLLAARVVEAIQKRKRWQHS